ncbi:hypothetical protein L596_028264 [Steinernema carpocapsae]|uniref:Uncharacterized protein n=1 Tax=Steinernema carpocapsae TaxID=34508 RepID=A0A4U5LXX8_STECR|nr:hypothetical protein L596_028264 [Steinernema carpocapsae]
MISIFNLPQNNALMGRICKGRIRSGMRTKGGCSKHCRKAGKMLKGTLGFDRLLVEVIRCLHLRGNLESGEEDEEERVIEACSSGLRRVSIAISDCMPGC